MKLFLYSIQNLHYIRNYRVITILSQWRELAREKGEMLPEGFQGSLGTAGTVGPQFCFTEAEFDLHEVMWM